MRTTGAFKGTFQFVGCISITMSLLYCVKLFEVNYAVKRCYINKMEKNTTQFLLSLALAANIHVFPTIRSQNKCCEKVF